MHIHLVNIFGWVHGDIRHLEKQQAQRLLRQYVHGDIRHLESKLYVQSV